jgi:hypothetical protein
VLAPGCRVQQVTEPTVEMLGAEAAFDVGLTWLQTKYPDDAPGADMSWVAEDVQVIGPDGEPILGAAQKRMISDEWVADITWALVGRDFVIYDVTLRSPSLGWFWNGTVKAVGGQVSEEMGMQTMTVDLASELARQFVVASRTYMSSGISQTLALIATDTGECSYCWVFVFGFDSENSGYGDTVGQVVVQEMTRHQSVIIVESMEVVEATMDGRWNMITQEFLELDASGARILAEDFVRNSPTFLFDGMPETLEVAQSVPLEGQSGWTVLVNFDSSQAGYGDRTGQVLAQVITPHEAVIIVINGMVSSAVMDDSWDMLMQKPVAAS